MWESTIFEEGSNTYVFTSTARLSRLPVDFNELTKLNLRYEVPWSHIEAFNASKDGPIECEYEIKLLGQEKAQLPLSIAKILSKLDDVDVVDAKFSCGGGTDVIGIRVKDDASSRVPLTFRGSHFDGISERGRSIANFIVPPRIDDSVAAKPIMCREVMERLLDKQLHRLAFKELRDTLYRAKLAADPAEVLHRKFSSPNFLPQRLKEVNADGHNRPDNLCLSLAFHPETLHEARIYSVYLTTSMDPENRKYQVANIVESGHGGKNIDMLHIWLNYKRPNLHHQYQTEFYGRPPAGKTSADLVVGKPDPSDGMVPRVQVADFRKIQIDGTAIFTDNPDFEWPALSHPDNVKITALVSGTSREHPDEYSVLSGFKSSVITMQLGAMPPVQLVADPTIPTENPVYRMRKPRFDYAQPALELFSIIKAPPRELETLNPPLCRQGGAGKAYLHQVAEYIQMKVHRDDGDDPLVTIFDSFKRAPDPLEDTCLQVMVQPNSLPPFAAIFLVESKTKRPWLVSHFFDYSKEGLKRETFDAYLNDSTLNVASPPSPLTTHQLHRRASKKRKERSSSKIGGRSSPLPESGPELVRPDVGRRSTGGDGRSSPLPESGPELVRPDVGRHSTGGDGRSSPQPQRGPELLPPEVVRRSASALRNDYPNEPPPYGYEEPPAYTSNADLSGIGVDKKKRGGSVMKMFRARGGSKMRKAHNGAGVDMRKPPSTRNKGGGARKPNKKKRAKGT